MVLVKIYEAPAELPDTAVIGRLSHYGRVLSFRRDKIFQLIENGVRTARMSLTRHIPSIINLAGEYVRIWYPNQPKTCRNCGAEDHLVKDCNSVRCFNCEKPGHRLENCGEPPKCTVCKLEDHRLAECPFVVFSANVDSSEEQTEEQKKKDKESYRAKLAQAKEKQQVAEKQHVRLRVEKIESQPTKEKDSGRNSGKDKGENNRKDKGKDNGRAHHNGVGEDNGTDDSSDEEVKHGSEKKSRSDRRRESGDEKERRDRSSHDDWKPERRRERDRDTRREREYPCRDYRRDRSSRREDYSDDDHDDGWTQVSYRRRRHHDY